MVANTEVNGRFHSDWLSMMYPRLKIARSLLSNDGAIFISIDEGEKSNLKRLCDEVFGEENHRNTILTRRRVKSLNVQFAENGLFSMNVGTEYILVYSKSTQFLMNALRVKKNDVPIKGTWNVFWSGADRPTLRYNLLGFTPSSGQWRWAKQKALEAVENYNLYLSKYANQMTLEEYWKSTGQKFKFIRKIKNGTGKNGGVQYWLPPSDTVLRTTNWTDIEVSQIKKDYDLPFENPKNVELIKELIRLIPGKEFTVLDFFAGSGTTADAIFRLNTEDGGNRKFVLVQIAEPTSENSDARQTDYKDVAMISKERIRLAGKNVSNAGSQLDIGFRVLQIDTSNMKDVYYTPDQTNQATLFNNVDNIKRNRTPEDLLFQVLVDWGVDLTLPIKSETINGKQVFFVDGNALVACFDTEITEDLVTEIAKRAPQCVVFRDMGFVSDSLKINVEQVFKQLSPVTVLKVL